MEMDLAPLQVFRDMNQFAFQTHMGHSCKGLRDMSNKINLYRITRCVAFELELVSKALKKFSIRALEVISISNQDYGN